MVRGNSCFNLDWCLNHEAIIHRTAARASSDPVEVFDDGHKARLRKTVQTSLIHAGQQTRFTIHGAALLESSCFLPPGILILETEGQKQSGGDQKQMEEPR